MKALRFPFFILVLFIFSGCGRGLDPAVVFSETRTLGSAGGSLHSASHDVRVGFAAGALQTETPVTLTVFREQFLEVSRDGYLHADNGVRLSFDPTALASDQAAVIELSFKGDYHDFGTMLAVMRDDGALLAVPSEQAGPGVVRGRLSQPILALLFPDALPGEQREFKLFSANRQLDVEAGALLTSVQVFQIGAFGGAPPALSGKRVALVVHGLDSSLADLTSLGQFLFDFTLPGHIAAYYDVVIGFNYTSNAPIAEIGTALADWMAQVGLQGAKAVDLFAHSMGNLVSRYAIETRALPNRIANIGHYVSLGGPHEGVPFANLPYTVQTFFYLFPLEAEPCMLDLLTDGKDGEPITDFLKRLNLAAGERGPNFTTTRYDTMSGSDWQDYDPPVGYTVNWLYWLSVGDVIEDGLVAQYSAQSSALSRQSQTWTPNPPLELSHTGLHDSPEAFSKLADWIESWQ